MKVHDPERTLIGRRGETIVVHSDRLAGRDFFIGQCEDCKIFLKGSMGKIAFLCGHMVPPYSILSFRGTPNGTCKALHNPDWTDHWWVPYRGGGGFIFPCGMANPIWHLRLLYVP